MKEALEGDTDRDEIFEVDYLHVYILYREQPLSHRVHNATPRRLFNARFAIALFQIHDAGYHREPRYLDLFDPGVSVVRDPKLDQPNARRKGRARTLMERMLSSLASTRVIIG